MPPEFLSHHRHFHRRRCHNFCACSVPRCSFISLVDQPTSNSRLIVTVLLVTDIVRNCRSIFRPLMPGGSVLGMVYEIKIHLFCDDGGALNDVSLLVGGVVHHGNSFTRNLYWKAIWGSFDTPREMFAREKSVETWT